MVGLKNSHIRKNLTKTGETQSGNAEEEEEDTDTDDALHKICCHAEIQGCYESWTRLSHRNFVVKLKNNTDSFLAPTGRLYTDIAAMLKDETAILETQVRTLYCLPCWSDAWSNG